MTSPTSFVFYERLNLHGARREEARRLARLHVTDTRMTLYLKEIVRTRKTGVLFEKVESQTTLSLHVNSKGEKYLKRFNKSQTGSIKDTSLSGDLGSSMHLIDPGYETIMKGVLFDWFDIDASRAAMAELQLADLVTTLLFPVVRDASFPRDRRTFTLLSELQSIGYPVTRTLRESTTWDEFLRTLCPMVQTKEDLSFITNYFRSLIHVAVLPVTDGLCKARSEHGTVSMFGFHHSFSVSDATILAFVFKYLPQEKRDECFENLMALTHFHQMNKSDKISKTWSYNSRMDFTSVPSSQRRALADYLCSYIGNLRETLTADPSDRRIQNSIIDTQLDMAVRCWYAKNIFNPRMVKTGTTVEDIRDHFFNLFGAEPCSESNEDYKLNMTETDDLLFFTFSEMIGARLDDSPSSDLVLYLMALVRKERFRVRGPFNAYIEGDEVKPVMSSEAYSADELIRLIDAGVAVVDAELTRLGRPTTPENRTAYLLFDRRERRFKNTWMYYDLGVRDCSKIIAFKRSGVRAKKDVMTYAGLPDEMFYEFLGMAAGKELVATAGVKKGGR